MPIRKWRTAAIILTVAAIAAIAIFKVYLEDRWFPKRFGVVVPGEIYRSGQIDGVLVKDVLRQYGIQVVIDLQYDEDRPDMVAEQSAIEALGITGYRFPLNGNGTGDVENYVSALLALHDAVKRGEPVLVHCAAGTQRTGGVLAAYRTLVQGWSAQDAVNEMARYDWDPEKDTAVLAYLDLHVETLARRLAEAGVIDAIPPRLPQFEAAGRQLRSGK